MKFLLAILNLFLYSNLFISVCAAAMTAETYLLIHANLNWFYIAFVFFSTLALYNFPVLFTSAFSADGPERHQWVWNHRRLLAVLCFVGSIAAGALSLFFPLKFTGWFIPIGLLALAYFFPQTRLRGITILKTVLVAFVWCCTTTVFPFLLASDFQLPHSLVSGNGTVLLQNFLFILPLCLVFNVRDIEADLRAGIRTIPGLYGVNTTVFLCTIFFALFFVLVILSPALWEYRESLLISGFFAAGLTLFASEKRGEYYYMLGVDGAILLQAILLFIQH